jgi:hypothetical protein
MTPSMSETQEAPDAAGESSESLARIDAWLGELALMAEALIDL